MTIRPFLVAFVAVAALGARADFLPREAHVGETIVQTVCSVQAIRSTRSIVASTTLTMRTEMSDAFAAVGCGVYSVLHQGVPAGTYDVVQEGYGFTTFQRVDGTLTVKPAGLASPAHRALSGNWFDPAAPGRGFNIVQGASGALLVVWLDYGFEFSSLTVVEPVEPNWLVITAGSWIAPNTFRGVLYRMRGTAAALPWDPAANRSEPVGLGTLTFSTDSEATFQADFLNTASTLNRPHYAATIRRYAF